MAEDHQHTTSSSLPSETQVSMSSHFSKADSVAISSIGEHDEDVLMAVQALGAMRRRAVAPPSIQVPPLSHSEIPSSTATPSLSLSTSTAPSTTTEVTSPFVFGENQNADFVSRMSEIPLVNTAIRAYEHGKNSSRVVKFGAQIVESSVLSVTKPIYDRLPVEQLDEFACRQLDRFSTKFKSPLPPQVDDISPPGYPTIGSEEVIDGRLEREPNSSGWRSVLMEAGGIGFAVSTESMRRLKYCLQWLQYATTRIDAQIVALQECISAQHQPPTTPSSPSTSSVPSSSYVAKIQQIRSELVQTLRQIVEVISKYAGGSLPEPARSTVREFVLRLPQRWATAAAATSGGAAVEDGSSSSDRRGRRSRGGSRNRSSHHVIAPAPGPMAETHGNAGPTATAQRILTLATESLDMLRNVTAVFNQSLEKAEAWVERLRLLGIDRGGGNREEGTLALPPGEGLVGSPTSMMSDLRSPSQVEDDQGTSSESESEKRPKKIVRTEENKG